MRKRNGYTLIEVLIAMAIVGVLAAIALPSYRQYVIRSNRRAAQTSLVDIASREQQFFAANRAYTSATTLGYVLPPDVAANYTFTITPNNAATPPNFIINFTAKGGQLSDGNLSLNSEGVKTPAAKW